MKKFDFDKILDSVKIKKAPRKKVVESITEYSESLGRNKRLLQKLLKGYKMYYSTVDVEMAKWSFNKSTGKELIFSETEHNRIYLVTLKSE